MDQYFRNRPDLKESYSKTARLIQGMRCKDIGLHMGEDDWEYPLWVLMQETSGHAFRIEHVDVANESSKIPLRNFEPCAVIRIDEKGKASAVFPFRSTSGFQKNKQ